MTEDLRCWQESKKHVDFSSVLEGDILAQITDASEDRREAIDLKSTPRFALEKLRFHHLNHVLQPFFSKSYSARLSYGFLA